MQVFFFSDPCWGSIVNNKIIEKPSVIVVVIKYAISRFLVPTRSSALLDVALQRLGHWIVNDKSNISFVDAHSERNSRDYDMYFSLHPRCLNLLSLSVWQVSVVEVAGDFIVSFKCLRKFFAVLPTQTVNDAWFLLEPRLQEIHQVLVNWLYQFFLPYFIY